MSAVNEKEVTSTLIDITSMLNTFNNRLESLNETERELASKASTLEGYNGAKVAGSNRSDYSLECTKYYYDKFNITGTSEIINSSNNILKETDRLQTNILSLSNQLKDMDSALAIITIYIANMEKALEQGIITSDKPYDKMSIKDRIYYAGKLMEEDKKNGYVYLDTTPILKEGKITLPLYTYFPEIESKYLEFYNKEGTKVIVPLGRLRRNSNNTGYLYEQFSEEAIKNYTTQVSEFHHSVMLEADKYGDKFKETAVAPLKQITFVYADYDKKGVNGTNWVAYTNGSNYSTFDMKYYMANAKTKKFAVDSFSHELGHSFDNSILDNGKLSATTTFEDIYNQINKNDSDYSIIREYGHKTPAECFAESTLLYYNDPASLKEIPLSGVGYDNLYEYMKSVLE